MTRWTRTSVALLVGCLVSPVTGRAFAQIAEPPSAPRAAAPLTILQVNDVYSTVPVDGVGGLARVATLKRDLAKAGRTPLLMIGGDFLSSSVASTVFKGEQMIAALNATGLDIATLGNHEFDFGVDLLVERMAEAKWQWVVSNLVDRRTGKPVGGASPYVIRQFGTMKVGILGLCLSSEGILPPIRERIDFIDPADAVATYLPIMKRDGANVIVLLTHLLYATDRALARQFPEIDVIVGGHEHYPIMSVSGRTLISKAGMDARFVARIDLDKRGDAPLDRYYELIPVTSAIKDDPVTAGVIDAWETRLGTELNTPIGTTTVPLEGRELQLRADETNLGDLVADAMRRQVDADVAIVNSGGLRGNRAYPSGPVTRRTLLEIHPFGNVVCKIEVSGRLLLQALNFGVSRLPAASGQFPQISGMTMRANVAAPPGARVENVTVNGSPLDLDKVYTLALPDFVLLGGDGYTMFAGSRVLIDQSAGTLIVDAIERLIAAQGTITPQIDGRIVLVR